MVWRQAAVAETRGCHEHVSFQYILLLEFRTLVDRMCVLVAAHFGSSDTTVLVKALYVLCRVPCHVWTCVALFPLWEPAEELPDAPTFCSAFARTSRKVNRDVRVGIAHPSSLSSHCLRDSESNLSVMMCTSIGSHSSTLHPCWRKDSMFSL